jgi:hypothetical protein
MFRGIFSLIIRSILTAITASGFIHVRRCRLLLLPTGVMDELELRYNLSMTPAGSDIDSKYSQVLLMMGGNIARNM